MVNSEDFIKRFEIVLEYYSISASAFADKVGVQRSALSHLLSGRNKPSLDFVLRIVDSFPEIDLYWLLNGKGSFPKNEDIENSIPAPSHNAEAINDESLNLFSSQELPKPEEKKIITNKAIESLDEIKDVKSNSMIDKIVVFYKDGTFKSYTEI